MPPKNQGLVKKVCFSRDLDEIYRLTQQKNFISKYFLGKNVSNFDTKFGKFPKIFKSKFFKIPGLAKSSPTKNYPDQKFRRLGISEILGFEKIENFEKFKIRISKNW